MNSPPRDDDESAPNSPSNGDPFADFLLAYDAAKAAGLTPSLPAESIETANADLQGRLDEARVCLELLHRCWPWPRAAEDDAGSAAASLGGSLGRYEVQRLLGAGGHGLVFLAYDPALRRQVALKVPRPEILASAEARSRFLREARAVARLDHPGIVPIHDLGDAGPVCYLAAAYIDGPNLADWLEVRKEALKPKMAARLALALSEAVAHAHSRNVLHRDLKPSNVLLECVSDSEADPVPRITDFGLAKLIDEVGDETATRTGLSRMGTPGFMAPEQADGDRTRIGPPADIFALGAILHTLLSGRPPTGSNSLTPVILADSPGVPKPLRVIVAHCLEPEPDERYANAEALADDLRRFLEGRPIKAKQPSVWERVVKWGRRHPSIVASILFTLILAIVMLATANILIGREQVATKAALGRAIEQEKLARRNAEEARVQSQRANASSSWFIQGITEPLKKMANPDLARNPEYAVMRQVVITEAIHAYEGFLSTRGEDLNHEEAIVTWIHIALLHTVADDHARAQDAYRQAIKIAERLKDDEPGFSGWYYIGQTHSHLGMELWDVGKTEESIPHFRAASEAFHQAVELEPTHFPVLQSAAWFLNLFQDHRYREPLWALELACRLVDVTSEREHNKRSFASGMRVLFTLGLAEYRVGNLDAARKALERSIELRGGGDAYEGFVLSMVLARQGELDRARQLHQEAVRWMRAYRYSDFELHALDSEASALLGSLPQPVSKRSEDKIHQ
jgi:eukaryotic-like serine/threonine-protein kinase